MSPREVDRLRDERDAADARLRAAQACLAITVRSYLGMLDEGLGHLRIDELREASRREQEAYAKWSAAVDAVAAAAGDAP